MFNRQLKNNIKMLDVQIGELNEELNGLKRDTKYDVKMRTLEDLMELRCKLSKSLKDGETSDVLIELDRQIEELTMIISKLHSDIEYTEKVKRLEELTKVRCQLSEVKSKESIAPLLISGGVSIGATLLVLKHEKTEIITSKAYNIVTKMFRGM